MTGPDGQREQRRQASRLVLSSPPQLLGSLTCAVATLTSVCSLAVPSNGHPHCYTCRRGISLSKRDTIEVFDLRHWYTGVTADSIRVSADQHQECVCCLCPQPQPHPPVELLHRQEGHGHRVAHLPRKWLLLKVLHVFGIFSLAPIRGPAPGTNRSCLKITREPIRMDCGTEFSKNGPALKTSHLSLDGSSAVQGTVVGEQCQA